jgi:hypothetical protein
VNFAAHLTALQSAMLGLFNDSLSPTVSPYEAVGIDVKRSTSARYYHRKSIQERHRAEPVAARFDALDRCIPALAPVFRALCSCCEASESIIRLPSNSN